MLFFILHINSSCSSIPIPYCFPSTLTPICSSESIWPPMGSQWSLFHHCIDDWPRASASTSRLNKSFHVLEINLGPTLSDLINYLIPALSRAFRGSSSVLCRFYQCSSRVSELSLDRDSIFCWLPHHVLDPLFILLLLPLFDRTSGAWPSD